jgi:hypothetical protein
LRGICDQVVKDQNLPAFFPKPRSDALRRLSETVLSLGELRNLCDYDPSYPITLRSAQAAIAEAKGAVEAVGVIEPTELKAFVTLIAFGRSR